jgi:hypothetical protein
MLSITIVSDATIWSITYDGHYDDHNSFIIQATELSYFEDSIIGWLSTVDLLTKLACFACNGLKSFNTAKTGRIKEVNCTEPSLSVSIPWLSHRKYERLCFRLNKPDPR